MKEKKLAQKLGLNNDLCNKCCDCCQFNWQYLVPFKGNAEFIYRVVVNAELEN